MPTATEKFLKLLDTLDENVRQFSARIDDLSDAKDSNESFMGPSLLSKEQILDAEEDINTFWVNTTATTKHIRAFIETLNTETDRLKILENFVDLQSQVATHAETLNILKEKHARAIHRVQHIRPLMNFMQSMTNSPLFDETSLYDTKTAIRNVKEALESRVRSELFGLATSHTNAQKAARKAKDEILAEQLKALSGTDSLKNGALQLSQQLETLRDRVATAPVQHRVTQLKLIEAVQAHLDAFAEACKLDDTLAQYEHAFAIDQNLEHALRQCETEQAVKLVQSIQNSAIPFFTEVDTLTASSEHATRIQEEQTLRAANKIVLEHALSLEKVLTEKVKTPEHLKNEVHAFIEAVKAWDEKRPTLSSAERKTEDLLLSKHYEKMAKYLNNKDVTHVIQSHRVLAKTANLLIQGLNAFLSIFGIGPFELFSSRRDNMRAIQVNMGPIQQQAIDKKAVPLFDTTTHTETATTLNQAKADMRAYLQEKIDALTAKIEQLEISENVKGKSLDTEKQALSQVRYHYQHQALRWLTDLEKGANTITPAALLQQSSHFASSVHASAIDDKTLDEHLARVMVAAEAHNEALGQPLRIKEALQLEQSIKKLEANLPEIIEKLSHTKKGVLTSQATVDTTAEISNRCHTLLIDAKKLQETLMTQREKNGAWMPYAGSTEETMLQALIQEAKSLKTAAANNKKLNAVLNSFLRSAGTPTATEHITSEMRRTLTKERRDSDIDSLSTDSSHSL